jgi:hypothetical protein
MCPGFKIFRSLSYIKLSQEMVLEDHKDPRPWEFHITTANPLCLVKVRLKNLDDMIRAHFMHVWKHHHETPYVYNLIYDNKKA